MAAIKDSIEAILRSKHSPFTGTAGKEAKICYKFTLYDNDFFSRTKFDTNRQRLLSETKNPTDLNESQKQAIITALNYWSNYANINFAECNPGEKVNFYFGASHPNKNLKTSDINYIDILAAAEPISNDKQTVAFFVNNDMLNAQYANGQFYSRVLLHEIGHGFGLSHPFDWTIHLPEKLDNALYTIMSYNYGEFNNRSFSVSSPMDLDIRAMQYLYGVNKKYNPNDNVIEINMSRTEAYTIWDGGGNDTISTSHSNKDVTIDLREGYKYPSVIAKDHIFYIAEGANIENIKTGSGNDVLTGNHLNNILYAGSGNNTITGGSGRDIFIFDSKDAGHNIIKDFITGQDKIRLHHFDGTMESIASKFTNQQNNIIIHLTDNLAVEMLGYGSKFNLGDLEIV